MKWPVRFKEKPQYGAQRNIWKFAWLPKKVKMWTSKTPEESYKEYWVWLENYHVVQVYSSYDFWFDNEKWTYPTNYMVVLES